MNIDPVEGRPLDDQELVERAVSGDVDAYADLVRRYQGVAHRVAYLITRSAAEAEDAAQSAFMKAFYALDRFRADAPFRPWLLQIVANEARNRVRSAGRRARLTAKVGEDPVRADAAPSPEAAVLAAEPRRQLLEVLNGMKEEDRLVISLRYFLDMGEAEMAEVMGVARGTVKSRLSRALERLRAAYSDLEADALGEEG